jgi:hypothetical protein
MTENTTPLHLKIGLNNHHSKQCDCLEFTLDFVDGSNEA